MHDTTIRRPGAPLGAEIRDERAPRVFRYSEHMLVPEIQSPEFHETPIAHPADDEIPETCVALPAHSFGRYGERFAANTLSAGDRASCVALMTRCGGSAYIETQPHRRIERRDDRLVVASR